MIEKKREETEGVEIHVSQMVIEVVGKNLFKKKPVSEKKEEVEDENNS